MAIIAGRKVEPFEFSDQSGKPWRFPEDFEGRKAALFFLRHLGCPLCMEKIEELKKAAPEFEDKAVRLIALVQSTPKRALEFATQKELPFLLVPDREKKLYQAFEVARGGLKEFMAPAAAAATIRATFKGHFHGKFEGDELQVPASFLLSPEREVLYVHYGKNISDFGSVAELLARA